MSSSHHIRHALLAQLEAADPGSLSLRTLRQGLAHEGLRVPTPDLRKHLHYLAEKGLLHAHPSPLCRGHTRYQLAAPGRDLLETP